MTKYILFATFSNCGKPLRVLVTKLYWMVNNIMAPNNTR